MQASGFYPPRSENGGPRGDGQGRRSYQNGNQSGRDIVLGFNALQKLKEKDPDDIVLDIGSERCLPAFRKLLSKTQVSNEMIELIMEILARCCDCNSTEYFSKLLMELPKSMFVILHLKIHITRLPTGGNTQPQSFVQHTVKLFSEILKKIPNAFDTLPLEDLEKSVNILAQRGEVNREVILEVKKLEQIKEESLEKERRKKELEMQRKQRRLCPEIGSVGPPPEDFREMTIIPRYDDIHTDKVPYLRKNIVQGRYNDLEHYLDVQFRLLREDFLRPLREGISDLISSGLDEKQYTFQDIRIYRNVKILYPECSNLGLRYFIQFDNSSLKRVRWENSKRLIFGSLLCFSEDNFQTFLFATVANRDPKDLAEGKVTVHFTDSTLNIQDLSHKNVYQMVETTAYFESYSPILKGLQATTDDLPFQRYLVECNKDIQPPRYLVHNRLVEVAPSFNFSTVLCDNASSITNQFQRLSFHNSHRVAPQFTNVPVLDLDRWPTKEQLDLDESQYHALQIALTKEVAVIQGPPGTGKTFLALKIAKLLLNNTEQWIQGEVTQFGRHREVKQTPILVICYTNHALDQFLEGIYDFHGGDNEDKIIRIGGRSKSEKLKECNLREMKSKRKASIHVRQEMYEVYQSLKGIKDQMEESSKVLQKCWQNILKENALRRTGVMNTEHFTSLLSPFNGRSPEQGAVVLHWLNLASVEQNEETILVGAKEMPFNGVEMTTCLEGLPLAGTDFSFRVELRTTQGGTIISSLPENGRWTPESKTLFIDHAGVVNFSSGQIIWCRSQTRVNDNKWHEIGIVYSNDEQRLSLYVDKRMEGMRDVQLPDVDPNYTLQVGVSPIRTPHVEQNFTGSLKNFVHYQSTKYNQMVMADANVEYEIEFMQEQRKVDDDDGFLRSDTAQEDDFEVIDPTKLVTQSSGEWQVQDKRRAKKKITFEIRKQLQSEDVMTDGEVSRVRDVWQLSVTDRWRLYRKWVRDISQQNQNTIASIQDDYNRGMKKMEELRNAESYELLREAHVIGMTTTGAAKYRELLHRIKPKITIVEEAAEVLESHIVTALTGGCQHLILIGDHKQLRPKPTVFKLGLDYQLDISLFERMIENKMPYAWLRAQHRMRPEISVMMRHIYDDLIDHDSVLNFEKIKGINKNMYFINHRQKEDAADENRSHSNHYEARFVGGLCEYLLKQGYSPSQITVLTPYTGQLFELKKWIPNEKDLRVCVVDNFQGEENEIIILSLVRSQDISAREKRDMRRLIGFLAIDNRICVSLSRAKKGFFCIGNLALMRAANDLWAKILDDMEQRGCVGNSLPLACQNHPKTITLVSDPKDFNKAPNGGCSVQCNVRLDCGHKCEQICHPKDPQHEEYDCRKKCERTCSRGHPCGRLCYQACNQCKVLVLKNVPICGHSNPMPCYQDPSTFQCTVPCPKRLPCGHRCTNPCGAACVAKCKEPDRKMWSPCGHTNTVECFVDVTATECPKPCGNLLKCDHLCTGTCGSCKQGRLHKPCNSTCGRIRFCDHACKVPCTKNCPSCPEQCQNFCSHSRCVNQCGEQCKECKEPCQWKCHHLECTRLCGQQCNRGRCDQPCYKILKCSHRCAGLCGEPCPKKCLVCDKDELTTILFGYEDEEDARFLQLSDCGHIFEVKGMDMYMERQEKDMKKGEATSIQMIKCPTCKTAIRTSLRYGNIIKRILRDFDGVKRAIFSANHTDSKAFLSQIRREIITANIVSEFPEESQQILESIENTITKDKQHVIENQIHFLKFMVKLNAILKQVAPVENPRSNYFFPTTTADQKRRILKQEMEALLQWVMKKRDRVSEQELEDFNDELFRAWMMFTYEALQLQIEKKKINLRDREKGYMERVKKCLRTGLKLEKKDRDSCQKFLEYLTSYLGVHYTAVTEQEKAMIVNAIGLAQGHWFKCPKGHFYCIGECGGAMQEAKCPECGSGIGGTQHRLREGNALAPEMDNARYAAWSDTANNMGNWDLRHLR